MTSKNSLNYQDLISGVIKETACKDFVVAYSGGLDSNVLLHLMHEISCNDASLHISAIHVNHGLSKHADDWIAHCRKTCASLNIPLDVMTVDASSNIGESRESVARDARYEVLSRCIDNHQALLTAHHVSDQAETLLLQLLRGSGLAGLASMPVIQQFGRGFMIKPLLGYSKSAIQDYANRHSIDWIQDDSNDDISFDRNYIRHCVMPVIRERWPSADSTIARTSRHSADAMELVNTLAKQDYARTKPVGNNGLSVSAASKLSPERQRSLIRYWIRLHNKKIPSLTVLNRVLNEVLTASHDRNPLVVWDNTEIRRYQDSLFIMDMLPDPVEHMPLDLHQDKNALPVGNLHIFHTEGSGIELNLLSNSSVDIRFRKGGESLYISQFSHRKRVKDILRENGIPSWLRDYAPIIYSADQLVGIPGICIARDWQATSKARGINFYWQLPYELQQQGLIIPKIS